MHITHLNPDGTYVHRCTVCGQVPLGHEKKRSVVWVCKCPGKQVTVMPKLNTKPRSQVLPHDLIPTERIEIKYVKPVTKPTAQAGKKPCNCGGGKKSGAKRVEPLRIPRDKTRPQ